MKDETPPQPTQTAHPVQLLKLDVSLYRHHLEDMDMSEEEIDAFLHSLWNVSVQFVDLGFPTSSAHRYIDGLPMNADDDDKAKVPSVTSLYADTDEEDRS